MKRTVKTLSRHDLATVLHRIQVCLHPEINRGAIILDPACWTQPDRECAVALAWNAELDTTDDIIIHPWVLIGPYVRIERHRHISEGRRPKLLSDEDNLIEHQPLVIRPDVWIGLRAIILCGCTEIAEGVEIGAGAVVTKSILEPYSIWAGVPARRIGSRLSAETAEKTK